MEMTLRWYGTGFDSVTLQQIRQVPGVKGVITTLYDSVPGDAWELGAIQKLKKELYTIISDHSGVAFEKIEKDSDRDYWMIAEEAKEYGMIDEVLIKAKH